MNEADGIRLMGYLDGTLPPDEQARVQAWLDVDPQARHLVEQHRRVWDALGAAYGAAEVQTSESFRRRAVARAQEPAAAPRIWLGLTGRAASLLAASLVAAIAIFSWFDRTRAPGLSAEDHDIVAHLDLLQSLDFIDKRGDQIDLAGGMELLAAFDGELPEASR